MRSRFAINRMLAKVLGVLAISTAAHASGPVPNPYLAAQTYAITHFDSAQSNAFPYAVPSGTQSTPTLAFPQAPAGPINLMTLATTSSDYMWGVSATSVGYIDVRNNGFRRVATLLLPGVQSALVTLLSGLVYNPLLPLVNPIATVALAQTFLAQLPLGAGGGFPSAYSVVDNSNVLYINAGAQILALGYSPGGLLGPSIQILRSLDMSTILQSGESITGVVMTYDGNLAIVGSRSLTIVGRNFGTPKGRVTFGSDETISNSAAVDENNAVYVVSDKLMRKVVWTGSTLSQSAADGAWSAAYPTGDTFYTLFGSGSGSTPALMGFGSDPDKLVVITDGKKQMDLVAFWRDAIPSGFTNRIAGQIPVTCGLPPTYTGAIQSDQSVATNGYGAFVVNNVSTSNTGTSPLVDNLLRGAPGAPPAPLGVQRFAWDTQTHTWSSVWARADVSSDNMIPSVSAASNLVFVNGFYPANNQGWTLDGLDWNTGATVHQTILGPGPVGNGFYAEIQYLPDGDLLFNSLLGPMRVQEPGGAVLP
ncbi:hypothetical protein AWB75_02423 [Caballeronia catudaia]|uniref:Lipoprotein n=1 Tax=Caballeronia catudaia TaxID=1777136 RepID=A0A158AN93_9BURK|nr:hypothetical protein [Caballeronia catudaia]SAK59272.1 hypothetical protein AWB75_02423 [Caballeronia catudaia]